MPIAEWLLALFTGSARAAAIMGDLTEMATTRGRRWFWIAYIRTLVSLGWRTPAAIVAAVVFARYLRSVIAGSLMPHVNFPLHQRGLLGTWSPHFDHFCWTLSLNAVMCAWIVFPYVAIRFGLHNRLTYLCGALFLLGIPTYSLISWVYELTGLSIAIIIAAALASPLWRRQVIFLFACREVVALVFYFCINDPLNIFHPHHHLYPLSFFRMRIDDPVTIAVIVLLGPSLHRWLLQPRSAKVANA
jgi:hypothetical protein